MKNFIAINKCLFSENRVIQETDDVIIFDDWTKFFVRLIKLQDKEPINIILFGSIENYNYFNICIKFPNNIFLHDICNEKIYDKATDLIKMFGNSYINYDKSYLKVMDQLNEEDLGKFIKSNNGNKLLTGQQLDINLLNMIRQHSIGICHCDILFLAPYNKNILREFRFFILKDKIIDYSEYIWDKNVDLLKEVPQIVIDAAENFIKSNIVPETMTLDLALINNNGKIEVKVIEINNFFTSGFYNCNIDKILNAVREN